MHIPNVETKSKGHDFSMTWCTQTNIKLIVLVAATASPFGALMEMCAVPWSSNIPNSAP